MPLSHPMSLRKAGICMYGILINDKNPHMFRVEQI